MSPAAGAGAESPGFATDMLVLGVSQAATRKPGLLSLWFPMLAYWCPNLPPLGAGLSGATLGPGQVELNEKGRHPGAVGRTLDSKVGHEFTSCMACNR